MAWVGFVNGKLLPIHWFEGSVNGNQYLEVLKNKVWPSVRGTATRDGLWFMQDGAKPHTTNDCLEFLQEKLQNRVVSNRLEFFWPAKSPDLNPLDFFFWGVAEKSVYDAKPRSLEQLKKVVELCAKNVTRETLIKAAQNFRKRATLCLANEGATSNTFLNSRLISFLNKTFHNMLIINVIKRTYISFFHCMRDES